MNGYDLADPGTYKVVLAGGVDPARRLPERYAERIHMALVENYAGAAAEARYLRRSMAACLIDGGAADSDHADYLVEEWFGWASDSGAMEALWAAERLARSFVRSPKAWAAISAVAIALHERGELGGAEIAALCASAYGGEPAHDAWALRWPPTLEEIRSGFLPEREPTGRGDVDPSPPSAEVEITLCGPPPAADVRRRRHRR